MILAASTSTWLTGLAVPVLLALGGFVTWAVRSTIEEYRTAERELTSERRSLYQALLEPYLLPLVSADDTADVEAATEAAMGTPEYRRAVFDLTLFASDDVVRVFGDITNNQSNPNGEQHPLVLWARLLLAIRKSVGNKGTNLSLVEMLRPTINDLDAHPEMLQVLRKG